MDYFNESWLDWIVLHKTGNILSDMRCCACQFEGLGFSHWTPPRLLQWYGISCHLRIYVQQHDHLSFNQVWLPQTVAPRLWSQTQNPDLYSCQLPQGCNIQRWQHGTFYQRWGPSHGVRMELCWRWAALIFLSFIIVVAVNTIFVHTASDMTITLAVPCALVPKYFQVFTPGGFLVTVTH